MFINETVSCSSQELYTYTLLCDPVLFCVSKRIQFVGLMCHCSYQLAVSWKTCYEPCVFATGCKMNLVMAEKDQPVFRDFLGLGRIDDISQAKYLSSEVIPAPRTSPGFESECDGETNNTRASSGISGRFKTNSTPIHVSPPFYSAIPSSSDPGSGIDRSSPSMFCKSSILLSSLLVLFLLMNVELLA